ncbi:hypothetical protein ACIA47_03920 [Micromonospora sp. NPDC051227]
MNGAGHHWLKQPAAPAFRVPRIFDRVDVLAAAASPDVPTAL